MPENGAHHDQTRLQPDARETLQMKGCIVYLDGGENKATYIKKLEQRLYATGRIKIILSRSLTKETKECGRVRE